MPTFSLNSLNLTSLKDAFPQLATVIAVLLGIIGLVTGAATSSTADSGLPAGSSTPTAATPGSTPSTNPWAVDPAAVDAARAQLSTLAVKGRAPKTGYDRALFGQAWSDDVTVEFGHNGCDTRNDILRRDLDNETFRAGTNDCVVATGLLHDPYTGTDINFVRGQNTSSAVQIDHVVPLSDAWQKGAQSWAADTRRNFANDPRNLLAVDGPSNQQKSDSDAATWLPANKAYRCMYAVKIIDVKSAYGIWVTDAERTALAAQLDTCR